MKKKILALVLALCMTVLTGCGSTPAPAEAASEPPETQVIATTQATEETEVPAETLAFNRSTTIVPTVLLDTVDLKITAKSLDFEEQAAVLTLDVQVGPEGSCVDIGPVSVNGVTVITSPSSFTSSPDLKVNLSYESLKYLGIEEIADIRISTTHWLLDETSDSFLPSYTAGSQNTLILETSAADSYDYESCTPTALMESGVYSQLTDCSVEYFSKNIDTQARTVSLQSMAVVKDQDNYFLCFDAVNTGDIAESVRIGLQSVNGLTLANDDHHYVFATLGGHSRSLLYLPLYSASLMEALGIQEYRQLDYQLTAYNSVNIEEFEETTGSIAFTGGGPALPSGQEVYWQNGIRILYSGAGQTGTVYGDAISLLFFVENHSGQNAPIFSESGQDVFWNGNCLGSFSCNPLPNGATVLAEVMVSAWTLNPLGITDHSELTDITVNFTVLNKYGTQTLFSDSFQFTK